MHRVAPFRLLFSFLYYSDDQEEDDEEPEDGIDEFGDLDDDARPKKKTCELAHDARPKKKMRQSLDQQLLNAFQGRTAAVEKVREKELALREREMKLKEERGAIEMEERRVQLAILKKQHNIDN